MSTLSRWISISSLGAAAVLLAACADSAPTAPTTPTTPDNVAASVTILDPGVVRDGDVATLRAEVRTADRRLLASAPVRWASTDPSVATIAPEGQLTALRDGTTDLVASSGTLQQRRMLQVVLHPAVTLEVNTANIELNLGDRRSIAVTLRGLDGRTLRNRPIEMVSSDPSIVRVGANGELIPVAAGTAVVTARYGALSGTARVRIVNPATSTRFTVHAVNGTALPATIDVEEIRRDGSVVVSEVTRIESGSIVTRGGGYELTLELRLYEQVELNGNISMRPLGRQTVRDTGAISYDWFSGEADFQSTLFGGLKHHLSADAAGQLLRFREPGTNNVWALGLRLAQ